MYTITSCLPGDARVETDEIRNTLYALPSPPFPLSHIPDHQELHSGTSRLTVAGALPPSWSIYTHAVKAVNSPACPHLSRPRPAHPRRGPGPVITPAPVRQTQIFKIAHPALGDYMKVVVSPRTLSSAHLTSGTDCTLAAATIGSLQAQPCRVTV